MKHVKQLTKNGCGQACIAMIAGVSFMTVVKKMNKTGKTTTRDIRKGLSYFKIKASEKRERISKKTKLPKLCMVFIQSKDRKQKHWVVYRDGIFWDPAFNIKGITFDDADATSFLEVKNNGPNNL